MLAQLMTSQGLSFLWSYQSVLATSFSSHRLQHSGDSTYDMSETLEQIATQRVPPCPGHSESLNEGLHAIQMAALHGEAQGCPQL